MDGYQCRTRGLPSIVIRTGPVIEPVKSWVQWFISPTIMNRLTVGLLTLDRLIEPSVKIANRCIYIVDN
jgi:hypothetical protein